jgi:hypothetical protein
MFLMYLNFNFQSNRTVILKNVFFCLFLVECFFMFGITQENIVFICTIMAAILHILLLCSFTWTLIEGKSILVINHFSLIIQY